MSLETDRKPYSFGISTSKKVRGIDMKDLDIFEIVHLQTPERLWRKTGNPKSHKYSYISEKKRKNGSEKITSSKKKFPDWLRGNYGRLVRVWWGGWWVKVIAA